MKSYTVSEVSEMTGVTIKTLHYYQKIDLLNPSYRGHNNYRFYTDKEIDVLQEIMFLRTMDISLSRIKDMLEANKAKTRIVILEEQLHLVQTKKQALAEVIETIEKTITAERNHDTMHTKEKFNGLKKEESIYQTMQNMTIIFSKPMSFLLMIFCFVLATFSFINLAQGISIYGDSSGAWIMSFAMGVLGLVGFVISVRNVFFVKTKDLLDIVNNKHQEPLE